MQFLNELLIICVCICLNAVFAAYEMALASISRARLLYLVEIKKKGASEALFMKDRMEASLAAVQLAVTLVGYIAAAVGGAGATEALNPYFEKNLGLSKVAAEALSLAVLVVPLSSFTIIFAELIPKTYALKNNEWVMLTLSQTMMIFTYIARPPIYALETIVKAANRTIGTKLPAAGKADSGASLHELTAALSMARASRLISAQQEKIVMSAAHLSLRPIKDIMIPAAEICMIPANASMSEALIRAHLDMHTRFPVCENLEDPQTILGYINFKDIILALKINPDNPTIRGTLRPLKRFQELTPISNALERMIQERVHIGLVEDTKKKITGMIAQEDIIEVLVGEEIEDEFDRLPAYIHAYGNQWLVGGAVTMSALAGATGIDGELSAEKDLKLADWCQRHTTMPFKGGETISGKGFQVTVRKLRRKKISEALVSKGT